MTKETVRPQKASNVAERETLMEIMSQSPADAARDMETKLLTVLAIVNDWLKFAEAKNAGLLVFAGAGIAGVLSFVGSAAAEIPMRWKVGLFSCVGFLGVCCLITLFSFMPRTKLEKELSSRRGVRKDTDNLYYYGDLLKYTAEELLDSMSRLYYGGASGVLPLTKNHADVAAQVVVNSQIAMRKYALFKGALISAVLALLSIPVAALIWYLLGKG